jgi:adenylate cyclase
VAHAYLAYVIWGSRSEKSLASARASAQRALSLDPNEPMAHFALGRVHVFSGEPEMAIAEMQSAIAVNPNYALAHYGLGQAYWYGAGQPDQALPHFDTALRLSPRNPLRFLPLMLKGSALNMLGRHDEAITVCRQACQFPDSGFLPRMHLAEALAEAGQKNNARAAVDSAIEIQPAFSISYLRGQFVNMHERTLESLLNSLRRAGVPE